MVCSFREHGPDWPQIPRFAFEKFPGSKAELTTQMKSVGEAMAIGRTFQARCCDAMAPSQCLALRIPFVSLGAVAGMHFRTIECRHFAMSPTV